MKKSLLYLFMLVCSVSLFSSCGDDDDEVKYPIDTDLAGGYIGKLSVVVDGNQMGTTENQKIAIAQSNKGANQIALSLKNFTFLINVGDIEVDPCTVKAIDGGYSFEGQQNLDLVAPLGNCPISILGTVKGSNINIEIGVKVGAPLNQDVKEDVKATFVGTKLTGNESSEAKITGFTFDSDVVTEQPVIDDEKGTITFKVSKDAANEALILLPSITVSEKAVVTPASNVKQDFSNNKKVEYTVTAEDGTMKKYSVFISGTNKVVVYDFEDWTVDETQTTPEYQYPIAVGGWASCNQAVVFIKGFGAFAQPNPITYNGPFPINKTEEAHGGNYAAELVSIDTTGSDNMLGQKVPKVTAGSIFLGTFVAANALKDPMTTTLFGIEYTEKPLLVKGFFKYTPGTEFYNSNGVLEPDTKDECALSAVLYEVEDVKKETLDGNNIYTSDKIVASAVYTNTGTSEYTPFELKLEYKKDKEYDPNKKYKFAVIFSASKDGAAYNAAVGSRLLIDDVTIVNE